VSAARWLRRVASMDGAEIASRARTAARERAGYLAGTWRRRGWRREELAARLSPGPVGPLASAVERLEARDYMAAHRALSEHFHRRVSRFPVSPHALPDLAASIRQRFPSAPSDAASRADALLDGRFDLLGFRGLDFRGADGAIDWHLDPVHGRRAPLDWWARVSFLDPAVGDHKIIWELNRHQHFLALGRATWLTGRPRYREACIRQLRGWLSSNPPLVGINWASMLELSLRSISWVWALHLFVEPPGARHQDEASSPWLVDLLLGVDRQLSHVERNLSVYFSPNTHLTGEALGLYVCGRALPELSAAARWADIGREALLREIDRQIAPDGGHVERSTHYQRYTLDFYALALTMARVTEDPCAERFAEAVARLESATSLLADPSGRLPAIGDDDGGSLFPICGRPAADARDSLASARALLSRTARTEDLEEETMWLLGGQPAWIIHPRGAGGRRPVPAPSRTPRLVASSGRLVGTSGMLADTGYCVSRLRAGDHVVIDAGAHGYLNGGHAHADALSLTATLGGRRLFIDAGTGTYTMSPEVRDRFRSSPMHNTLTLDGVSQSRPAGPFHWHSVANGRLHSWHTTREFDFFEGSQDGYLPALHVRRVVVLPGGPLLVVDTVSGPADGASHRADVHWHVAPEWRLAGDERGLLTLADGADAAWLSSPGDAAEIRLADQAGVGWHSPAYGVVDPSLTVRLTVEGPWPLRVATLAGLGSPDTAPRLRLVEIEPGAAPHAVALEVLGGDERHLFVMSSAGQPVRAGGIETDARLVWVRSRGGRAETLAIVDGEAAVDSRDLTPQGEEGG
jgi:hypothetical protein